MPAAVESMISSRVMPWHRLGVVIPGRASVAEALNLAHLADWNVHTEPVLTRIDSRHYPLPRYRAIVRTSPVTGDPDPLAIVGLNYKPIQNEDAFAFGENILDIGGAHVETAGSLHGGRTTWVLFATEDITVPGTSDVLHTYLLVATTHDGTSSVTVKFTSIRVVCANTLGLALGQAAAPVYRVRHVGSGVVGRVADARAALDLAHRGADALADIAGEWAKVDVNEKEFTRITERLFPLPHDPTPRQQKANATRRELLGHLYLHSPTQNAVRGTAWGVLQAAVEMADWYGRGSNDGARMALRQIGSLSAGGFKAKAAGAVRAVKPRLRIKVAS